MTIKIVDEAQDLQKDVHTTSRVPVAGDKLCVTWEEKDEEKDFSVIKVIKGEVNLVCWAYAQTDVEHECVVFVK